ncbi:MAG: hypothetical protein WC684_08915 [Hyphomicrobium sp.]|jgi:hypothetical protein
MQEPRIISLADHKGGDATSTEALGLFHDAVSLQNAVDDLLTHGFDHSALSVLADARTITAKLGHGYNSTADLEDDPDVPRVDYVPNETIGNAEGGIIAAAAYFPAVIGSLVAAASGGTLLGVVGVAAIAGGTGAGIGAALAGLIGREHARHLDEHIRNGGLILWVRTPDGEHERAALDILAEHGGEHVRLHDMPPTKIVTSIPTRRPLLSFGPAA